MYTILSLSSNSNIERLAFGWGSGVWNRDNSDWISCRFSVFYVNVINLSWTTVYAWTFGRAYVTVSPNYSIHLCFTFYQRNYICKRKSILPESISQYLKNYFTLICREFTKRSYFFVPNNTYCLMREKDERLQHISVDLIHFLWLTLI